MAHRALEIGTNLSYIDEKENIVDREYYVDSNVVTMHSPDIEF
jgi:hypothetical protein